MTFVVEHMPHTEGRMILEQRYGAAQIAVRATDELLLCAHSRSASTVNAIRRDIFKTGWNIIRHKQAVGSLVNLLSGLLHNLDSAGTVTDLQATVETTLASFRHRLNQGVPDTAVQSMSVLSDCRRIILYGYSTTVLYALQHALRNGHRIDVLCVSGNNQEAHQALIERIAAIGLTVTSQQYAAVTSFIGGVDAVVVGADSLDVCGLTNTAGTRSLASLAYSAHIPFYTFCTSEKLLPNDFFYGEQQSWPFDDTPSSIADAAPTTFDITPIERVTGVITERGSLPAPALEAWLAAERIHPWLSGRGSVLDLHQSLQTESQM